MTDIRTAKAIRKDMKALVPTLKQARDQVHALSMDALRNYKAHGSTNLMSDWINMLQHSGVYRQALLDWFKKHAHVHGKTSGDKLVLVKDEGFKHGDVDLVEADDNPFWQKDTNQNANLPTFDAMKVLSTLLKRQDEAKENPQGFKKVNPLSDDDARLIAGIIQRNTQKGESTTGTDKAAGFDA